MDPSEFDPVDLIEGVLRGDPFAPVALGDWLLVQGWGTYDCRNCANLGLSCPRLLEHTEELILLRGQWSQHFRDSLMLEILDEVFSELQRQIVTYVDGKMYSEVPADWGTIWNLKQRVRGLRRTQNAKFAELSAQATHVKEVYRTDGPTAQAATGILLFVQQNLTMMRTWADIHIGKEKTLRIGAEHLFKYLRSEVWKGERIQHVNPGREEEGGQSVF